MRKRMWEPPVLKGASFSTGERVRGIVVRLVRERHGMGPYPLQSQPFCYCNPFKGAAEGDWDAP